MDLHRKTATELSQLIQQKEISASEVAKSIFENIDKTDGEIGAFLSVTKDQALHQAEVVDKKISAGEKLPPLAGIPIGIKDNICTKDIRTTCASKMLESFIPFYNATVMDKLHNNFSMIVGKLNMDEFAMGSSCENSYFKTTTNPWDFARVPGGSSGGSAAAVAACQVPLSLGSDTGGSIRMPASMCGVVGLKPTYGAISRYGLIAFASSLDQVGPFGRTVEDVALIYKAICGPDYGHDATSKDCQKYGAQSKKIDEIVIGIPDEYYCEGVSEEVKQSVYAAIIEFETLGAKTKIISLPSTKYALSAYYIISSAEASSNLARFDGLKYGYASSSYKNLNDYYEKTRSEAFGDEVKRRIMLGTYVLSSGYYDAYYKRAKIMQKLITKEFEDAFEDCDALITPTCPTTAFKIGEKTNNPLEMYAADICTVTVNIAGLPAISVPCGFDSGHLPIGMQIIAPKFKENTLLYMAQCYETAVSGFEVKGAKQ